MAIEWDSSFAEQPIPEHPCEDAYLTVRSHPNSEDAEQALRGLLSEEGELEHAPFVRRAMELRASTRTPRPKHEQKPHALSASRP